MDPLLPFSSKFSLEKKFRSKPSLVVETVDPLLPFSPKYSLEKFSSKPSLVVEIMDPLLPFSSQFSFEKKFRSKYGLVVKPVDPLLPSSSKFSVEKNFSLKPQVDPLLPLSSKFSLENIDKSVNSLSNIRSKSSLVTNPSCNSSSNLPSSVMTFKNSIFTLPTTQVLGVHVQYLPELHQNKSLWLDTVSSILDILVKYSSLKCFLISLGIATESIKSSQPIAVSLRDRFPMWVISVDTMIAFKYGDNIYASRITFR